VPGVRVARVNSVTSGRGLKQPLIDARPYHLMLTLVSNALACICSSPADDVPFAWLRHYLTKYLQLRSAPAIIPRSAAGDTQPRSL